MGPRPGERLEMGDGSKQSGAGSSGRGRADRTPERMQGWGSGGLGGPASLKSRRSLGAGGGEKSPWTNLWEEAGAPGGLDPRRTDRELLQAPE